MKWQNSTPITIGYEALNSPTSACLHQVLYAGPLALDHSRYADGLHVRYGPVDHGGVGAAPSCCSLDFRVCQAVVFE